MTWLLQLQRQREVHYLLDTLKKICLVKYCFRIFDYKKNANNPVENMTCQKFPFRMAFNFLFILSRLFENYYYYFF